MTRRPRRRLLMASLQGTKNYRCVRSLRRFYTGGPFAFGSVPGSEGDAKALLACAYGGEVRVVSAADATAVGEPIDGDFEAITALALSPDCRVLYAAQHSGIISVWDLDSGTLLDSWLGHDGRPVMVMACSSYGVATAESNMLSAWDLSGRFCTTHFRDKGVVNTIMFHKDPEQLLLFSGSNDGTVRVWNLKSMDCISVLDKHTSMITSLDLSEDGQSLITAGRDMVVNIWDVCEYNSKKTIRAPEMVESVSFIGMGSCFFACLSESENLKGKADGYFLTVGEHGIVRIWSLESADCIFVQHLSIVTINSENEESRRRFTSTVILPNNEILFVTADQQFLFYRPKRTDQGTFELNLYNCLLGYNDEILDLKFVGEEENYLAVATNLEQVHVYDATSSCSYMLAGHIDTVVCLDTCVSPSGRTLLVTGSKDCTVRLWDMEKRNCIGTGKGHLGAVSSIALSKKTNFFVSGSSDRVIKIWNWDDIGSDSCEVSFKAEDITHAHIKDINSLSVSPADDLICSGSQDCTARIWKLCGKLSGPLPSIILKGHKRGVWSVEFSPDQQFIITSSGDSTVKLWGVADGSCLKTFDGGHTSIVLRASFLPNGTQFVSCGTDGLVKIWTIETSECIAAYDKHNGKVMALTVGRKTPMLATGGTDAVINLCYDCTTEENQQDFCKKEAEDVHSSISSHKDMSYVTPHPKFRFDQSSSRQHMSRMGMPGGNRGMMRNRTVKGAVFGSTQRQLFNTNDDSFEALTNALKDLDTKETDLPPDDIINSDDRSSLFKRRTLEALDHLFFEEKLWLKEQYVIAEGMSRRMALEKIDSVLSKREDENLTFWLPSRGSHENGACIFDKTLRQLCLKRLGTYRCQNRKASRIKSVLLIIRKLLMENNVMRLRTIYYRHPSLSKDELDPKKVFERAVERISDTVSEISAMLEITRECLNIQASPKGCIIGPVCLLVGDDVLADCRMGGSSGCLIPSEAVNITQVQVKSNEKINYVLVLEKETVFHCLADRNFHKDQECIMVTGKGQPDVATRILLRKLADHLLDVPFYALVDGNPSGASIFSTYRFGSMDRAYDNLFLTVPERNYIGLFLSQLHVLEQHRTRLSEIDEAKLDNMLALNYIDMADEFRANLLSMKMSKFKVDIEFLMTDNTLEEYIIKNIQLHKDKEDKSKKDKCSDVGD